MYNDWLTIGPITIHGYGVMIAIGILFAFWVSERRAKQFGLNADKVDSLIFSVIVFGYVCAKLLYCIVEWETFIKNPAAVIGSGGWVVYGGIIGGILTGIIFCRMNGMNFPDYFNILIPQLSLAQGFGRIGCFFAGCCYGKETSAWYGVTFPSHSLCPVGHPVIPTQLISAAYDFLLFFWLYQLYNDPQRRKYTGANYLLFYGLGRFMIEFFRGDSRGSVGILSTSQFISLFIILAGAALMYWNYKKKEETTIV